MSNTKIYPEKNLIVVEGEDDEKFIRKYLKHLKIDDTDIQTYPVGGVSKLKVAAKDFAPTLNSNNKISIIFDANSNYKKNKKNIMEQIGVHAESVDIFLFPDNQGNGSLETLLERLIKCEYKHIFECFEEYKQCIEDFKQKQLQHDEKAKIYVPSDKQKIYIYQYVLGEKGKRTKKGKNSSEFKTENWDFNHEAAQPLKEFLEQFSG